jgi:formamidopyrimidine-DNA glycosylase
VPELPEVEYVRRELRRAMQGARIEQVILRRANLRLPFSADFADRIEGQTVRAVNRRAKYLLVELSSGDVLVMHLGMSGWFRVGRPGLAQPVRRNGLAEQARQNGLAREVLESDERLEKHDHVVFEISNGTTVIFNDPRRFGFMKVLAPTDLAADRALAALGPEPLARAFTAEMLAAALAGRKTSLKVALLDQRSVAGLGNIYACEALHVARLSPKRRASTLVNRSGEPKPEAFALVTAIRAVLDDAIANRHHAGGEDRFRVYDHEGERCPRRRCPGTIKRIVQAGRSTFFCPVCQR